MGLLFVEKLRIAAYCLFNGVVDKLSSTTLEFIRSEGELKRDRDHIVLTAEEGVAMVIMDRQDYIIKFNNLLNQPTYRTIPQDPPYTIKNKLISILQRVKNQTDLDSVTYKSMYPTGFVGPKFYGLPKVHKLDTPLRPILSSCHSVTYAVVKNLPRSINPW